MQPLMTTSQWLMLDSRTRHKLIEIFKIQRSSGTQILDSRVISDGHTHQDLQVINVESMQNYLKSEETDFFKLFNEVLESIKEVEKPIAPTPEAPKSIDIKITLDGNGNPGAEIIKPNVVQTNEQTSKEESKVTGEKSAENKGTVAKRGGRSKGNTKTETASEGDSVSVPTV